MEIIKCINIFLVVFLLIIGIETILKLKNSQDKLIEQVRKQLIIRINIIMVLTVVTAIFTIINMIF